ncbi:NUDIX hydrolase [Alteriqipengyuania sp. 357]
MRHLLPKPVERFALRIANRLRHHWRRIAKPQLYSVTVLLRDRGGRVLFIRHSYGPSGWTLPGGGMSAREAPEETARREMHEELGVRLDGLELLETFDETVSGAPQRAHVFTARLDAEPVPDGREVVAAQFFAMDEVPGPISALTRRRLDVLRRSDRA